MEVQNAMNALEITRVAFLTESENMLCAVSVSGSLHNQVLIFVALRFHRLCLFLYR